MREIGAGFVEVFEAIAIGHDAEAEPAQLGQDEPHPVRALLAGPKLGQRQLIDPALRRDEAGETQSMRAGRIQMTDMATTISRSDIPKIHRTTPSWRAPVTCSAL
ncbi:hypothetical protein GCM10022281_09180 [Sphingomonas rosea]|uniref:Uncharacterized protein n=1 Tax=Sphingomonas rosea TaxID=335605 RepID=A0ABP7TVN1_9SPHN